MKRILFWFAVNGSMLATGYYGLFGNLQGARYIFFFLVWLLVVRAICALCHKEKMQELMRRRGRPVPVAVDIISDMTIMFMLVWTGHWITGIFFLIHTLIGLSLYGDGGFGEIGPNDDE